MSTLVFRMIVGIVALIAQAAAATVWGDNSVFPRYVPPDASFNMYMIKPTDLQPPGLVCAKAHALECPLEVIGALHYFRQVRGQVTLTQLMDQFILSAEDRRCVSNFIFRLYRMIYVSEPIFHWLIEVNKAGINLSRDDFIKLYNNIEVYPLFAKHLQQLPGSNFVLPPGRPKDPFKSTRCDLHFWYIAVFGRYANYHVGDMQITVIPQKYMPVHPSINRRIVISPSAEVVVSIIDREILRVKEGFDRGPRKYTPKDFVYTPKVVPVEGQKRKLESTQDQVPYWDGINEMEDKFGEMESSPF